MKVIGLAGWSGAGKTTLLVKLIPALIGRGLTVSTLKHAHHAFDIDHPGKDSFEHRTAGASEVLVASGRRYALIHELRQEPEPPLADLLGKLSPVDLVLVEGFKRAPHPKIEIYRAANGKPFLFPDLPNVRALISDVLPPQWTGPHTGLNEIERVADLALDHARPLADVVATLRIGA
ncbi:molybdopterin-guanine dinucleotide biosynthesis protein B [Phreatobacter aquaticus]|uniref:Molybdopterin-guanine dinucleotide biosynthesis protein B n=1 Tax=Phreatobacter aquaticus TaxID=2570229 RepID=A0A4D7QHX1_9HYPH|nr:molybdopterin-guanine dinucleotide biosynthesis protein B [Phreatobacter aquaticus]QCK86958.1 molybdopterin-guanine dinucleotide biosynthesis protein B [Phreatobacter aquaticus]